MVGIAIEEAYDDENQRVGNHHCLVAYAIDYLANNRCEGEARNGRNGIEKAYYSGVGTIEENEYVWTEGEEYLLPCAIEHLQHIVL